MAVSRSEAIDFIEELAAVCALSVSLADVRTALRRRAKEYIKASVAEVYSPPWVTKTAAVLPRLGIEDGAALDLTTRDGKGVPWDFSKEEMKRKAKKLLVTRSALPFGLLYPRLE